MDGTGPRANSVRTVVNAKAQSWAAMSKGREFCAEGLPFWTRSELPGLLEQSSRCVRHSSRPPCLCVPLGFPGICPFGDNAYTTNQQSFAIRISLTSNIAYTVGMTGGLHIGFDGHTSGTLSAVTATVRGSARCVLLPSCCHFPCYRHNAFMFWRCHNRGQMSAAACKTALESLTNIDAAACFLESAGATSASLVATLKFSNAPEMNNINKHNGSPLANAFSCDTSRLDGAS